MQGLTLPALCRSVAVKPAHGARPTKGRLMTDTTTTTTTATALAIAEATRDAALAELNGNPAALSRIEAAADEARLKYGNPGMPLDEALEYQRLKAHAEGVAFVEARAFGQSLDWAKTCAAAAGGAFKRGFHNPHAFIDRHPEDLSTMYEQAAWRAGVEAGLAKEQAKAEAA